MSVLPPTYVRAKLFYTAGLQVMAQQKEIHNGRMDYCNEISKLQGKVLVFTRELKSNMTRLGNDAGINLEV